MACGGGAPGATLAKDRRIELERRGRRAKRCMVIIVLGIAARPMERRCDGDFFKEEDDDQDGAPSRKWRLTHTGSTSFPVHVPLTSCCSRGSFAPRLALYIINPSHSKHARKVHRHRRRRQGEHNVSRKEKLAYVRSQVALKFASSAVKQGSKVISVVRNDSQ